MTVGLREGKIKMAMVNIVKWRGMGRKRDKDGWDWERERNGRGCGKQNGG